MKIAKVLIAVGALFITVSSHGDTVYLKNGGSVEGIIEKEDEKSIEINMGFGTVTFSRAQIKKIEKSSPEDSYKMSAGWEAKRKELAEKEKEFAETRDKRFKDAYENWMEDESRKKEIEEGAAKNIQITKDPRSKSLMVEALLNEKVKAVLILDTGASLVVISRRIGEELGVDLSDTKTNVMEMHLADGKRTPGKVVVLDSVRIQDVEVRQVKAVVMLEEVAHPGARDGLLGMSFLSRFNLKTDLKNMKMTLEKIEK